MGPRRQLTALPAPVLVLVAITSVQIGAATARTSFDELGATGITLLRLGLSGLLMVAVLRPRPWRWSRDAQLATAGFGLAMGVMNVTFYLALRTVPLGVCVTVEFLGPLCLALVQTRQWREGLWVALAGAGVALLGLRGDTDFPKSGLLILLVTATCWALYILASARVGQLVSGSQGLACALVVAALVALPFGAPGAARAFGDAHLLLIGCSVALLSSVIPYSCELAALRRLPTQVFGVLMSLEPGAAAIAGWAILDQSLDGREVVALVLVTIASAGITLTRRTTTPPVD